VDSRHQKECIAQARALPKILREVENAIAKAFSHEAVAGLTLLPAGEAETILGQVERLPMFRRQARALRRTTRETLKRDANGRARTERQRERPGNKATLDRVRQLARAGCRWWEVCGFVPDGRPDLLARAGAAFKAAKKKSRRGR
jgi:hypothetical protein